MKKPILLTKKELIKPFNHALDRLVSIKNHRQENVEIILEGLFVLAVSSIENSILDSLKKIFYYIPHKLDFKSETLSKEDIISGGCLEKTIDNKIMNISYKNAMDIIDIFIKTLSLECKIEFGDLEMFQEIKARRNLLIHNNLIINRIYEDTAGPCKNLDQRKMNISADYLQKAIRVLETILSNLIESIEIKYKDYTKINALRNLWNYTFSTPIMQFENEWIVDEKADTIFAHNSKKSHKNGLSSSESMFYNIWHAHICGIDFNFKKNNIFNLSEGSRQKFVYLLTVADLFKS